MPPRPAEQKRIRRDELRWGLICRFLSFFAGSWPWTADGRANPWSKLSLTADEDSIAADTMRELEAFVAQSVAAGTTEQVHWVCLTMDALKARACAWAERRAASAEAAVEAAAIQNYHRLQQQAAAAAQLGSSPQSGPRGSGSSRVQLRSVSAASSATAAAQSPGAADKAFLSSSESEAEAEADGSEASFELIEPPESPLDRGGRPQRPSGQASASVSASAAAGAAANDRTDSLEWEQVGTFDLEVEEPSSGKSMGAGGGAEGTDGAANAADGAGGAPAAGAARGGCHMEAPGTPAGGGELPRGPKRTPQQQQRGPEKEEGTYFFYLSADGKARCAMQHSPARRRRRKAG